MKNLEKPQFLDRRTPPTMITLVVLAGLGALAQSIFLPSLSDMAGWFGVEYHVMQLAISGYLAVTALMQLIIGPMADRFGRRPIVIGGLVLFLIGTAGAILAPSAKAFLLFRMLQSGVAAGLVLSRAVVRDMLPRDEAAAMIGYVTMCMAVIPMAGPMVGGALDAVFGWRASFVLLLILGLATLLLGYLDQGETAPPGSGGLLRQIARYPQLLRSGLFWGYALCTMFGSAGFFVLSASASFIASQVFGLSNFWAGVGLGAPALGYAIGNFLSGRFSVRFGIDRMILCGMILTCMAMLTAFFLAIFDENAPIFYAMTAILGIGNGMLLPNATSGLLSVRPDLAGTASGLGAAFMMGGGAIFASLSGFVLDPEWGTPPLSAITAVAAMIGIGCCLTIMRRSRWG